VRVHAGALLFHNVYVYLTNSMDQTAHKLVVNPEQSGGIIAVGAKSPKGENLQFTVTTEAQRADGDEGVIQLDLKPPGTTNTGTTNTGTTNTETTNTGTTNTGTTNTGTTNRWTTTPDTKIHPKTPARSPRHSPPPRHLPHSPPPRQRSYASEMYSSEEGSPRFRHGSPSFDVSGLANPNKMRRNFREHHPPTPSRSRSRSLSIPRPPAPRAPEVKPSTGFSSIREEKLYILLTLKRMRGEGFENISDFTADSDIEEMRIELKTLQEDSMVSNGIENCRTALITLTTGTEILNKKYNPFDLDLDGWSQSIFESIERYDGVLEKLTRKYVKRVSAISPEIQLLLMLCGSAASFCFTKSMMKAAQPTMTRIAEENPELIAKMMQGMARDQGAQAVPAEPVPMAVPVVPAVPVDIPAPRSSRYEVPEAFMRPPPQQNKNFHKGDDDNSSVSFSIFTRRHDLGYERVPVCQLPGKPQEDRPQGTDHKEGAGLKQGEHRHQARAGRGQL
jgi:hypothetical protein